MRVGALLCALWLPCTVWAAEIALEQSYARPGTELRGTISGLPHGAHTLLWRDSWGILWEKTIQGPGETTFALQVLHPRAIENELVLECENISVARTTFSVVPPPSDLRGYIRVLAPSDNSPIPDDFPAEAILWRARTGARQPERPRRTFIVDLGLDEILRTSDSPPEAETLREKIREVLSPELAALAAAVSLGDNFSPPRPEPARLGDFFRTKYGNLERLSRVWGIEIKDWEEAVAFAMAQGVAPASGTEAAWSELLSFQTRELVSTLRVAAEEVNKLAPAVPIGLLAGPEATRGEETWLTASFLDWRGGKTPGGRVLARTGVFPGGRLAGKAPSDVAEAVLAAFEGELIHLFEPSEASTARACGVLAGALGKLLELSRQPGELRLDLGGGPRVAFVYSAASARASSLLDGDRRGEASWVRVWEAWCSLLYDLGVPFECVTEAAVAQGSLGDGFGVCILPRVLVVDEPVSHELRRFVSSGGIVLTDAGTGLFDENFRRPEGGVLKDLLGLEHDRTVQFSEIGSRRVQIAEHPFAFSAPRDGASWFPFVELSGIGPAEKGLRPIGARAEGNFGKVPCLIVNRFGGGWAATLNLAMSAYLELRHSDRGAALRQLVRTALARAGVRPTVELRVPEGAPMPSARVRELRGMKLIAVARPGSTGRRGPSGDRCQFRLRVGPESSVATYESLTGSFLGWTNEFDVELAPGEFRIYAVLPYRLSAILLEHSTPRGPARTGVEVFEVSLRKEGGRDFAPHMLSIEVIGPDGRERGELQQVVEVLSGKAKVVIPFALSDPSGPWTLRAKDAATGTTALKRFVR